MSNNKETKSQIKLNRKMRLWNKYRIFCIIAAVVLVVIIVASVAVKNINGKKNNELANNNVTTTAALAQNNEQQTTTAAQQESTTQHTTTQAATGSTLKLAGSASAEQFTKKDFYNGTVFLGDSVISGISGYGYLDNVYGNVNATSAKLEDYVARNLVRASTTKMAQSRQKMLERLEPVGKPRRRLKPPKIRLEFETEPVKDVLTVENLTIAVGSGEKERVLLSGAEFNIQRGDKVAIIGPNGSGKTTLLRALLSAQPPVTGRISWGRGVKRSYYDQGSDHLDQSLTVMDTMWKAYPRMYETPLRTALGAMGLTGEDAYRLVGQLSGGERARLKLAMICLAGSNVLVLDEPTNHLDLPSKEVLQQALSEYEGTLIIVSHDRYLLDRVPNRIFAIENGKLTQYKGGYGDYLKARAEQGSEKAAPANTKTDSEQKKQYNRGKEQRREDARRRKEYAEAEALIHTLE